MFDKIVNPKLTQIILYHEFDPEIDRNREDQREKTAMNLRNDIAIIRSII